MHSFLQDLRFAVRQLVADRGFTVRRDPDPRARNRREHRHFQRRGRRAPAAGAGRRSRPARDGVGDGPPHAAPRASRRRSPITWISRHRSRTFETLGGLIAGELNLAPASGEPIRLAGLARQPRSPADARHPPDRGRHFTPEEDRANGPQVALISESLWERSLGRDRGVLGSTHPAERAALHDRRRRPGRGGFRRAADPDARRLLARVRGPGHAGARRRLDAAPAKPGALAARHASAVRARKARAVGDASQRPGGDDGDHRRPRARLQGRERRTRRVRGASARRRVRTGPAGAARPAGRGRTRAARRVGQRREPAAGARGGTRARDRGSHGARRGRASPRPAVPHRNASSCRSPLALRASAWRSSDCERSWRSRRRTCRG